MLLCSSDAAQLHDLRCLQRRSRVSNRHSRNPKACSGVAQMHAAMSQTGFAASENYDVWLTNMHSGHMWGGHERTWWSCRHSGTLISSTLMQTFHPISRPSDLLQRLEMAESQLLSKCAIGWGKR